MPLTRHSGETPTFDRYDLLVPGRRGVQAANLNSDCFPTTAAPPLEMMPKEQDGGVYVPGSASFTSV